MASLNRKERLKAFRSKARVVRAEEPSSEEPKTDEVSVNVELDDVAPVVDNDVKPTPPASAAPPASPSDLPTQDVNPKVNRRRG